MSKIKHINVFGDLHDLGGDGSDQAVINITRNGTTFTATRADGTTFTFTQQDLNTWQQNSNTLEGYVPAGSGHSDAVWGTDENGNPAWRNAVLLDEGTDLNDITEHGEYWASGDAVLPTLINSPFAADSFNGFNMEVKKIGGTLTQIATSYQGGIMIRHYEHWEEPPRWTDWVSAGTMNSKDNNGLVAKGSGHANQVWMTNASGSPAWREMGYQLIGKTELASNTDLNTVTARGEYVCGANTTASTITHSPVADTAFRLRVESSTNGATYIRQTWIPYNSFSTYVRSSTDGGSTWSAWRDYSVGIWQANSNSANGYVPYGNGHNSQVWATDASGNPSWRTSALYHNTRTTSANNKHSSITDERVTAFLATSSMTTGKPPTDAHVLHFNWDNGTDTTGTWDAQLAIRSNTPPKLYIRSQGNGTWSDWQALSPDPTPTVHSVSVAAASISLNTFQNIATISLPDDGRTKLVIASLSWAGPASARYVSNFSKDANQVEAAHNSTAWSVHHIIATQSSGTLYLRLYSSAKPTTAVSGRVTVIPL